MKFFEARIDTIIMRYYLLMLIVIVPPFLGVPYLSLLALPVFLSAVLGVSFKRTKSKRTETSFPNVTVYPESWLNTSLKNLSA